MSDEPKELRRFTVMVSDDERACIEDAINLVHALHNEDGRHTPESNGDALHAICAAWLKGERARIRGEKGA